MWHCNWTFHQNPSIPFRVILQKKLEETNRQIDAANYKTLLAEVTSSTWGAQTFAQGSQAT